MGNCRYCQHAAEVWPDWKRMTPDGGVCSLRILPGRQPLVVVFLHTERYLFRLHVLGWNTTRGLGFRSRPDKDPVPSLAAASHVLTGILLLRNLGTKENGSKRQLRGTWS